MDNNNFIILMPCQLINTFILSYYILHQVNPLQSILFHQLNNIFIIFIMHNLYKYFPNKKDNQKDIDIYVNKIIQHIKNIKKSNIL
jgi:hypothetical protein